MYKDLTLTFKNLCSNGIYRQPIEQHKAHKVRNVSPWEDIPGDRGVVAFLNLTKEDRGAYFSSLSFMCFQSVAILILSIFLQLVVC